MGSGVKTHQEHVTIEARGPGLHDVTVQVARVVKASGVRTGMCNVFLQHTSASLVVQENADPAVRRDLQRFLSRIAPESADYEHDTEGPDDMPAHIKAALTATSLSIPVVHGKLGLGTWQGIYLWEHRRRGCERELLVHVAA